MAEKCEIPLPFTGHLLPESLVLLSPLPAMHCPTVTARVAQLVGCCTFFKTNTVDLPTLNLEALANWGIYIYLSNDTT
jgi:hypothetical protein